MIALILCTGAATAIAAKTVTIHNDRPRLDVDGNYLDAHDGKIVAHNGETPVS
jgi:hypothetical protein